MPSPCHYEGESRPNNESKGPLALARTLPAKAGHTARAALCLLLSAALVAALTPLEPVAAAYADEIVEGETAEAPAGENAVDETDAEDAANETDTATDPEAAQKAEGASEHAVMGSSLQNASSGIRTLSTGYTWIKSGSTWTCSNGTTVTGASAFGVDVSEHNGDITWADAKADGVEYAIIRCGYGSDYSSQDDEKFVQNVRRCIKNGIPFGIYLYSYASNTSMAASEADHVLRLLEEIEDDLGVTASDIDYPIYLDLEESDMASTSNRTLLANIANTFCTAIEDAGYTPGVYANLNWWNNYLTSSTFDQWTRWVAQYNTSCNYTGAYEMWQCSSSGSIDGISGNVDVDFSYMTTRVTGVSTAMNSTTAINVSWSSVSGADGYQVAYREGAGESWTIIDVGTTKSKTISVAKQKAIAIKVRAYTTDEDGITETGKWSTVYRRYSGKTSGLASTVKVGKKTITAKWSKFIPSSGTVTYKVQYRTAASSSWKTVTTSSPKTVLSIKKNKAYQVRVFPVVKVNGKSYLGVSSVTYRLTSATTPTISRNGKKSKGTKATVTMSKVSVASGYQVAYSAKKSFSSYSSKKTTGRTSTITGLKRAKTYYVKVRTYKVKGGITYYGPWSSAKTI